MSPRRQAILIAAAFVFLRIFFGAHLQLAQDEAYYWEWSRTLDLSYYDQGPMLALAIRAGTALLGTHELGVRLVANLSALAVSGVAIWACEAVLGVAALAPWMVLAFNGMLLFSVGGLLMMHDSLLGLFWMLALAASLKALRQPRWWLVAGLAAGLAFLSKYTGVLLFGCLGLFALARPQERAQVARSPWFWAGGLLGSLGALPVLVWNWQHQWPSFQHVFSLAGGDASRRDPRSSIEFIGSQFGLVTPVLLWLVLMGWRQALRQRRELAPERWLLFCCSAPVALFFLVLSFRTRIEGNWPAPAYLGGLLLAGAWLHSNGGLRSALSRWALGLALAFGALAHVQAAWSPLPLPVKLDTTTRLAGWRELGQRVEAERAQLGAKAFVGARTYQNAAELAFYLPEHPRVLILQSGTINHQYRFWNQPELHVGQDAILVAGQDWELSEMAPGFARTQVLPDHVYSRGGVEIRRTRLLRAYAFKGLPK